MTPTIRMTSIIISCSLGDKFSPSSATEFLGEVLTRTVFPIRGDGRVTPSVTRYMRLSWRARAPGAQKPGPERELSISMSSAPDRRGWFGHGHWASGEWAQCDEMTIRQETARTSRSQTLQSRSQSQRNRSQVIGSRDIKLKLDFPVTFGWFRKCELYWKKFQDALFNWIYKILVAQIAR